MDEEPSFDSQTFDHAELAGSDLHQPPEDVARNLGLIVVESHAQLLQLDLDSEGYAKFQKWEKEMSSLYPRKP